MARDEIVRTRLTKKENLFFKVIAKKKGTDRSSVLREKALSYIEKNRDIVKPCDLEEEGKLNASK